MQLQQINNDYLKARLFRQFDRAILREWRKARKLIKPKVKIDIIEWAENEIVLPDTMPIPGPFRIRNSPHLKEVLRAYADPEVRKCSIMGCAQFGKTLLDSIDWAFKVINDPAPNLIGHPTDDSVKSYSLHKLWPLIYSSPILKKTIKDRKRGGTDESSIRRIQYPGGWTEIVNLTARGKTRQRSVRDTRADDIDELDVSASSEGDHLFNFEKRTTTYKYSSFNSNISVPHLANQSNIEALWKQGSQEEYYVRCPKCNEQQVLDDDRIEWEKEKKDLMGHEVIHRPETATVACAHCGYKISEKERIEILQHGVWIARYPDRKVHRSFHLNQTASTLTSLQNIATERIKAEEALAVGSDETWESYINNVKGLPYRKIVATETDARVLIDRREDYIDPANPAIIPNGVLILTAAVDAQAGSQSKNPRFEVEVWGWGYGEECWIVDKFIVDGSPEELKTREALKKRISSLSYKRKDGLELRIRRIGFDSGWATQSIYELCERMSVKGWYATKGANRYGAPLLPKKLSVVNKNKTALLTLGSQAAKEILFERLNTITDDGPKRIHHTKLFCDLEYFDQLTAEQAVQKTSGLMQFIVYEKKKSGLANEAIDLWCGAYAMMKSLNINWKKYKESVDRKVGALSNEELTGDLPRERDSELRQSIEVTEAQNKSPVVNKPAAKRGVVKRKQRTGINKITNY